MKIKPTHIKKFEAFIQEAKDPNAKNTEQSKNDKKSSQADEDEEPQSDTDDEDDIVAEMKRYFAQKEKNHPYLWKSAI
ncbi:hypothetical protein [Mucilaginibacter sp.]|uniref:hypothetical protein n=1 Tax=Mucilaginibacter sp. TaxID=1882438 RepID=UPI0025FA27C1|nr:hypothetical protein [Mucilaginibacter sp.]